MADLIPLTVSFLEVVHARFKGNKEELCQARMTGEMMLSFPKGILDNPNPSQLCCQVNAVQPLTQLVFNKELVTVNEQEAGLINIEFNMSALTELLRKHADQNPTASQIRLGILQYNIMPRGGATSCPLHMVAFRRCVPYYTDLCIYYVYNRVAIHPYESNSHIYPPLHQVCVATPLDGYLKSVQTRPNARWFSNTNRVCWKLPALTDFPENLDKGTLRARFTSSQELVSTGSIAAQFTCENGTLSGCDFHLTGQGYRVSLIKKGFVSGKYTCEVVDSAMEPEPSAAA